MDLPCPFGKRKVAPWTLCVHWEEEKCPTDPHRFTGTLHVHGGGREMPHRPSMTIGRRRDAPWTLHVLWEAK